MNRDKYLQIFYTFYNYANNFENLGFMKIFLFKKNREGHKRCKSFKNDFFFLNKYLATDDDFL